MPRTGSCPVYPGTVGWAKYGNGSESDDSIISDVDTTQPSTRAIKQEGADSNNNQIVLASRAVNHHQTFGAAKQEDTSNENTAVVRHKGTNERASTYDWVGNLQAAKERAARLKIVELLPDEVGRLVMAGQVLKLWNENMLGALHFITYEGTDVLARIPVPWMKDTIIDQLAALHIGRLTNTHPDNVEFQVNWRPMEHWHGVDWVVHIHPTSGSKIEDTDFNLRGGI